MECGPCQRFLQCLHRWSTTGRPTPRASVILPNSFHCRYFQKMAEFICRLGTPAGEVVTRTVEAAGVNEARARLELEGFRVFNVTPPKTAGVAALTQFGRGGAQARVKANDFLLFNQQLAALSAPEFRFSRRFQCCAKERPQCDSGRCWRC